MAENTTPRIRFAGFTDAWEQRRLGELYEKSDEKNSQGIGVERTISVSSMTWNRSGNGAAISSLPSYKVLRLGDLAFEGNRTKGHPYGKLVINDLGEGIMSSRFRTLHPKVTICIKFWKYFISDMTTFNSVFVRSTKRGTLMTELVVEDLFSQSVPLPSLPEQRRIGELFSTLDSLITLHQRKLDALRNVKKALLDRMFPREGQTEPELRFAGFTDAWEQRRLGELYRPSSEKNNLTFGTDRIISVANMFFNPGAVVGDESYLLTYNVMRLGDIAFEGNRSKHFAHGRLVENTIGDGIVSHVFKVFRPIGDFDLAYWKYAINNERIMQGALTRSTKASTMMNELVVDDLLRESIPVPPLPEQRRIGELFSALDSLITLHQRKLDALRNVKKSLLDRMFV